MQNNLDYMILLSMIINQVILKEWGFAFSRILTIIVPVGMTEKFLTYMQTGAAKRLSMYVNHESIDKALLSAYSSAVMIPYTNSARATEMIRYVANTYRTGKIGDEDIVGMPILVTESRMPSEAKEFQFFIRMDDLGEQIKLLDLVPETEMLMVVANQIGRVLHDNDMPEERTLKAAACFYYPKRGDMIRALSNRVQELFELDEEMHEEGSDLSELFIDALYSYQEETHFQNVFPRGEVPGDLDFQEEKIMLYEDGFIYMNKAFFDDIAAPLCNQSIPEDCIKQALVRDKILIPNEGDTTRYSTRILVTTENRNKMRVRILKFASALLMKEGIADVVTQCINRKRGSEK